MHSARNLTLEDFYLLNPVLAAGSAAEDEADEDDELEDEEDEDEQDNVDDTDAQAGL